MSVPAEIRAVSRPKNTIVQAYGKNKDHYCVRERVGCKYVNGRRIPQTGHTIGHIINGEFVPIPTEQPVLLSQTGPELKDWADIILCDRLFQPVMDELLQVYNPKDAQKIYCIALLQVCFHGIKYYELAEAYQNSFVSELYPGVALSANTVSTFVKDLGKAYMHIRQFMQNRTALLKVDGRLVIDGTLKSDESKVNSLSNFSRKARIKGTRDISVIYAFDLERMQPVCSECFPGNMLDATAYGSFIKDNGIHSGLVVADKGFPATCSEEDFSANEGLHYLNPVRRNSKYIETHKLLEFKGVLPGFEGIMYKKSKVNGKNKWLYSFRDEQQAHEEERGWLSRHSQEDEFSFEELKKRQKTFGVIVLECDLDLDPQTIYKAYSSRWEIEIVMRYYKHALDFDETRVQSDCSVYGAEFLDFLSTDLTYKLINRFDQDRLLEQHTYKQLMKILKSGKKLKEENEWTLIKMNPSRIQILEQLEILETPKTAAPRKRGKPKGSKNKPKQI